MIFRRINLFVRSLIFTVVMVAFTPIWTVVCVIAMPLPYNTFYHVTTRWNAFIIWLAKVVCGIHYQVKGIENLPDAPAILLCKHQSAWETIFLLTITPRPLIYVLKKELLQLPFFGWSLAMLGMIGIDRKLGMRAFRQVILEGKKRLNNGQWIGMFPEGTRTAVGEQGEYKGGGTRLATSTNSVIIPIALNSGECWPKNSFIKIPGTITVSIGPPISPDKMSHGALMNLVESWIEAEMRVISPDVYNKPQPDTSPD